ncbi:MAG: subclass B3 metallo-beta-lactamase [Acidobacteria bacterium]|nr:subclass B3 metallo-beta-lactamase [Acidobacteriota bacterium]
MWVVKSGLMRIWLIRLAVWAVAAAGGLWDNATALTLQDDWTRPMAPFRMVGPIYWVGSHDLSTYLITTPAGHILINTGIADTADQIAKGIVQLGFSLADVKVLTATHAHYDHAWGLAELKRRTKARVVVNRADRELFASGGKTDYLWASRPEMHFEPVPIDDTFTDGGTISLGGVTLTAHHHPGHSKGATSFTLTVRENGRDYRVIIANMGSINPGARVTGMPSYPDIGRDYALTFERQKAMSVDVFLASHASQFRLHEQYTPGAAYDPARFVDPDGFRRSVEQLERTYREQLARERVTKP